MVAGIQPVSDVQLDVPVRRPILLKLGRRNNLRENMQSHDGQLWVPGLQVHLISCL